jgi:prepilin-type N-terminal cleavage/methylation domain-containing protein
MANLCRKINALKKKRKGFFFAEKKTQSGFTLIEVMIVMAIILVLLLIALWAYQSQLGKGRDSRRKADLNMLEKVFEDYYNDHNCYPERVDQVVPNYLSEFPQDPVTREYYEWTTEDCHAYRIYAKLDWEQDPMIVEVGCGSGCGPGGGLPGSSCDYNYGVCSQNTSLESCGECPNACQGEICNVLNKSDWSCPHWFCDPDCEGNCTNPAYQCTKK